MDWGAYLAHSVFRSLLRLNGLFNYVYLFDFISNLFFYLHVIFQLFFNVVTPCIRPFIYIDQDFFLKNEILVYIVCCTKCLQTSGLSGSIVIRLPYLQLVDFICILD